MILWALSEDFDYLCIIFEKTMSGIVKSVEEDLNYAFKDKEE